MPVVDTSYLTSKQKFRAVSTAKAAIALNGFFFTSVGIASMLPSVRRYVTGGNVNALDINASILSGSLAYIGISNLASLLSLDVMSCLQQLQSNMIGYAIYGAIGAYYGYKFYQTDSIGISNPYDKKLLYFVGTITGAQMLFSMVAARGINQAYPTKTLLFTAKIGSGGNSGSKKRQSHKEKEEIDSKEETKDSGNGNGNDDNKMEIYGKGTFSRGEGGTWRASNYKYKNGAKTEEEFKNQSETLVPTIDEDAMAGSMGNTLDSVGVIITNCQYCQFKVESNRKHLKTCKLYEFYESNENVFPIRGLLLEESNHVTAQVSYCKSSLNIVNCQDCSVFVTHRAPVIEIGNCNNIKLSICKEALAYLDVWTLYSRADSEATIIYKETIKQDIADGMLKNEERGINKEAVNDEKESANILRWMNNRKSNEKWVLTSRTVNEPNISVSMTSGLELSINYFGKEKPLDKEHEAWLDYNAPYQTSAKFDLANGKMKMELVNL